MYRSNPHQWANMALAKPEEQRRVEELLLLSYSPVAVTTSHSPYLTSFSSPLPSSHREAVVPTGGESSEDYPYGKELPKTQHQVTVTRVPRAASFSTSSQPAFHSEPSSAGSTPVPPPPPTPSTTNSEDAGAGGMFSPPPPPPESPFPMSSAIGSPYSMRPDMHVRSDSQCSMDSVPPPPPPSDTPRAFGAPSATTFKEERISRPRSDSGSSIDSFIPPPPPPLSQPLKRPRVD